MAIHKSKSTNLSNQQIHILLYLIIFTFRLLQAYITSILGLFLFSYVCTLPLYVLSELYFANFILYVFILLFFVTCVINYFLVTYKSQQIFSLRRGDLISRCCPSVCLSVGRSVCRSVCPSVLFFLIFLKNRSRELYCLIRPSLYCLIHFSKW